MKNDDDLQSQNMDPCLNPPPFKCAKTTRLRQWLIVSTFDDNQCFLIVVAYSLGVDAKLCLFKESKESKENACRKHGSRVKELEARSGMVWNVRILKGRQFLSVITQRNKKLRSGTRNVTEPFVYFEYPNLKKASSRAVPKPDSIEKACHCDDDHSIFFFWIFNVHMPIPPVS